MCSRQYLAAHGCKTYLNLNLNQYNGYVLLQSKHGQID
jgi:hypothetical protein